MGSEIRTRARKKSCFEGKDSRLGRVLTREVALRLMRGRLGSLGSLLLLAVSLPAMMVR